jgi:hypothetical protein
MKTRHLVGLFRHFLHQFTFLRGIRFGVLQKLCGGGTYLGPAPHCMCVGESVPVVAGMF